MIILNETVFIGLACNISEHIEPPRDSLVKRPEMGSYSVIPM